jgi:hypothetical protein
MPKEEKERREREVRMRAGGNNDRLRSTNHQIKTKH